jgi:hypothetical protein
MGRTGHFYSAQKVEAHLLDLHSHNMFGERKSLVDLISLHDHAHAQEWGVPHVHDEDGTPRPVGSQTAWGTRPEARP